MPAHDTLTHTTRLLERFEHGDREAAASLFERLYDDLHALARGAAGGASPLSATELVHECWLKLGADPKVSAASRQHFLRVASRAMRSVVIDHVRRRRTLRRGDGIELLPIDAALDVWEREGAIDPLELDELLTRLEEQDERLATIVQLRFFTGLGVGEVAEALDLTRRQVEHAWDLARAWLARELRRADEGR